MIKIDGSSGEGGGQIVRTALTLSCITSTPIEIHHIRANRNQGGLRPQHLACVQAAAQICAAEVTGDYVGSHALTFVPGHPPKAGEYQWDIKTAGATTLLLQTVLLPLAMAEGSSTISAIGGTHVPNSPSGHYLRDVYAPMLIQSGVEVFISLERYGWYPKGGGEITASLEGWSQLHSQNLLERGELERVIGVGLVSKLPVHIPKRLSSHAEKTLSFLNVPLDIRAERDAQALSAGAGVYLTAEYSNGRAGFSAPGERGVPSEDVAEEATFALQVFDAGNASVDKYLADQLVLMLALAEGESQFITPEVTQHLETNCRVIRHFIDRAIHVDNATGRVRIEG
ncbi:MAG TPA: RNA 3'-terminal phosphate cyclase [Aggregatilineales bacterium]|nr:RNA 3'-terminal phosphate cyclase [Aggregatilineales bacterium]